VLDRAGARALVLGCGSGWPAIALARSHPGLCVHGLDPDEVAILEARRHAAESGVSHRVRFEVGAGAAAAPATSYDVAFVGGVPSSVAGSVAGLPGADA
jgi:methylase of polypeptide subunit release factors